MFLLTVYNDNNYQNLIFHTRSNICHYPHPFRSLLVLLVSKNCEALVIIYLQVPEEGRGWDHYNLFSSQFLKPSSVLATNQSEICIRFKLECGGASLSSLSWLIIVERFLYIRTGDIPISGDISVLVISMVGDKVRSVKFKLYFSWEIQILFSGLYWWQDVVCCDGNEGPGDRCPFVHWTQCHTNSWS